MPIPLLVPILGAIAATVLAEEEKTAKRPEWSIDIDDDQWNESDKGHVLINFEDRVVLGDTGRAPAEKRGWYLIASFDAPYDGEGVRGWFEDHLDELELLREQIDLGPDWTEQISPETNRLVIEPLIEEFSEWLQNKAHLASGEWKINIDDDMFDNVWENGRHGAIYVDFRKREITGTVVLSGSTRHIYSNKDEVCFSEFSSPISGIDIRDWFESKTDELENARTALLARGNDVRVHSLDGSFESSIQDFRKIFFSPAKWLGHLSENGLSEIARDLLRMNLKEFMGMDEGYAILKFSPEKLAPAAASFLEDFFGHEFRRIVEQIDLVEGEGAEVLKILDEPYLFLDFLVRAPDMNDQDEVDEHHQDARQVEEDMERWAGKEKVSIQENEDGTRFVRVSLPWSF